MIEGDAVDQSRAADAPLLPGELVDTLVADDAEHWVAVYEELIGFLLQLDPPGEKLQRYRSRLAHWRRRRDELGANGHAGEAG